jgi:hypothetical protein
MSDFDVNLPDASDNVSIRKHQVPATTGRFLGTTGEWDSFGSSPSADYAFAANTQYVGVFSVTRTGADSVEIFSSIRNGSGLMDSHSVNDTNAIANHFGMLGFWANSSTFGSSSSLGAADNGIDFSNIKVERVMTVMSPPTLSIRLSGSNVVVSWPTSGTSEFALQTTTSLTPPAWGPEGTTPTVVGADYQVTNSAVGGPLYYRLMKP